MLIPPNIRKCVAFIGYRNKENKERYSGTGFFISMDVPDRPLQFIYLITAKHVINRIKANSIDDKVLIRINDNSGGVVVTETETSTWTTHETNESIDVTFVCASDFFPNVGHLTYPLAGFVTAEIITRERIEAGTDVFSVGLFRSHYGKGRNIPVIRLGNIAAMPEEPWHSNVYGDMDVYLIEGRSIGGVSGAPVFVAPGPFKFSADGVPGEFRNGRMEYLLGMIHGHFDVSEAWQGMMEPDTETPQINSGISIVIPAARIVETLHTPSTAERREFVIREWDRNNPR